MSGKNRYDTAINVSKALYSNGSDNLILVNSEDYADGYLASSLSVVLNAPILTTEKDYMDVNIRSEIMRLRPKKVYVIGGTGVVSENIAEKNIKNMLNIDVKRIKGADKYETAINVAKEIGNIKSFNSIFLIPSNDTMIDGGIISSISGNLNIPILYTNPNELVSSVKNYISSNLRKIKKIYLISGLFSNNVVSYIKSLGIEVETIKGSDRYKTNANLLNKFNNKFNSVVIVNNQIDLIGASSFAAKKNSALFYVNNEIDEEQIKVINKNNYINTLYYFGGSSIKTAFRNMVYEIKKSNLSKCGDFTKQLLYMNKHAVIYIPHQDDEASHLGQVITAAVEELGRDNVHLVEFTDGSASAVKDNASVKKLLKEYNLTLMQARDREFIASVKELGVKDYVFVENLYFVDNRFPDKGLKNNVNKIKEVMKYYDNLYGSDGGVTHFSYTNLDAHEDHNTLGTTLRSLYFDASLDNNSFSDVYFVVKYKELEGTGKHNIPNKYFLTFKNPSSYPLMLNAFEKYKQDLNNGLLGIGYKSAPTVFDEFTQKIKYNNLVSPIHVPY